MDDEKTHKEIPKHFILLNKNNPKDRKFGWLENGLLKTIALSEQKSTLKYSSDINKTLYGFRSFVHAIGSRKITFSDIRFKTHLVHIGGKLGDVNCSTLTYSFKDIFLDIHYTDDAHISSITLRYPFAWGRFEDNCEIKTPKTVELFDGKLEFMFVRSASTGSGLNDLIKSRRLACKLTPRSPFDLEKMMEHVWHFNNFLMLIRGEIMFPDEITAVADSGNSFTYFPELLLHLKQNYTTHDTFPSRIWYEEIMKYFDVILNYWFNLNIQIKKPISEYFQTFYTPLSPRSRLLETTNVLQRIYKKTDPQIDKLLESMKDAAKLYRGICNISDEYLSRINKTRNHYVHGDANMTKRDVATELNDIENMACCVGMLVEGKLISEMPVKNASTLQNLLQNVFYSRNFGNLSFGANDPCVPFLD